MQVASGCVQLCCFFVIDADASSVLHMGCDMLCTYTYELLIGVCMCSSRCYRYLFCIECYRFYIGVCKFHIVCCMCQHVSNRSDVGVCKIYIGLYMLCRSFMCFQLNLYTCVVYYFMNTMFVASCCFLFLRISSPNLVRPPSGAFGLFYLSFRLNIWKNLRRHILDTYWQNSKIETKKMRQLLKSIQSL